MMHFQGLNANIMSLGGIAIAVGAMVDAAIVMIENAHKRLEEWEHQHPGEAQQRHTLENHYRGLGGGRPGAVYQPADHYSVVYPDFHPRRPGGQTVRPAGLHQNLVDGRGGAAGDRGDPDPDGLLDPRQDPSGEQQSAESLLIRIYHPLLLKVLHWPKTTLLIALLSILTVVWPLNRVGGEFLPQINEGDLLYMPSTLPGISAAQAADMLQKTDKLIMAVPEVARVFGKTGKAETATDSAPLEMVETTIQLKPQDQWRPGMTMEKIVDELDKTVRLPGLANLWVPPIRNRIDMLSTGIKSPIGIKVSGTNGRYRRHHRAN